MAVLGDGVRLRNTRGAQRMRLAGKCPELICLRLLRVDGINASHPPPTSSAGERSTVIIASFTTPAITIPSIAIPSIAIPAVNNLSISDSLISIPPNKNDA